MLDLDGFLAMVSDGSSVGGITAVEKLAAYVFLNRLCIRYLLILSVSYLYLAKAELKRLGLRLQAEPWSNTSQRIGLFGARRTGDENDLSKHISSASRNFNLKIIKSLDSVETSR